MLCREQSSSLVTTSSKTVVTKTTVTETTGDGTVTESTETVQHINSTGVEVAEDGAPAVQ